MEFRDIINAYLMFMWNVWGREVSDRVCTMDCRDHLQDHLWEKWVECCQSYGAIGAPAVFWSVIDRGFQNTICELIEEMGYKG